MRPFARCPAILVGGSAELAETIAIQLRGGGRPARLWAPDRWAGRRLRSTETLILADPTDPAEAVAEAADLCRRRTARRPPLRLILVSRRAPAPERPPSAAAARLQLEDFVLEDRAARLLLARSALHAGFDPRFDQPLHLLIAGAAPPARSLLAQALRVAQYGPQPASITIACTRPVQERDAFFARYPQAAQVANLSFTALEAPDLDDAPPISLAYVCISPAERGLMIARRLIELIRATQGISPVVHLEVGDAMPRGNVADWDGQILPFSYVREATHPDVLLGDRGDELAQLVHEHYRDTTAAQGRDPALEPAGRPWASLGESYRNASRHQSDHLWAKLAVTDCSAVEEDMVETFAFTPLEVERLAMIEHRRWAVDRYLDGWTYAPTRDNGRKHHPQLIPFDQLTDPMKDLDRFAVRLIPTLLARRNLGLGRSLLVGIPGDTGVLSNRVADAILRRLTVRYPSRRLVLASTLEGAAARRLVRRAFDQARADLYLLCRQPLGQTLEEQPHQRARTELLGLAARASRRYCFSDIETLDRWYRQRAEIVLTSNEGILRWPGKTIGVRPDGRSVQWNFEY